MLKLLELFNCKRIMVVVPMGKNDKLPRSSSQLFQSELYSSDFLMAICYSWQTQGVTTYERLYRTRRKWLQIVPAELWFSALSAKIAGRIVDGDFILGSRVNSRHDSPHLCAGGSLTNFDTSTKLCQKRPTKRSPLRSVENPRCH
jgi:hypothetical protein